jgi:glycosyltransferase involved in cell wall biosynthesis
MNKPIVSVIMITYNHEKYISEAIEGVLMQITDFPIELIIGEDCSTDSTRKIVIKYAGKYPILSVHCSRK